MKQGGNHSSGFTIVETLIVLAVTSTLLISALALINGRQGKTEFQVGINDLKQHLQQIINETAAGYYPNNSDFKCQGNSGSVLDGGPYITSGAKTQGTNEGCIFVGKALQFSSGGGPSSNLTTYPLVGNQKVIAGGNEVVTLAEAKPTALAKGFSTNTLTPDDITAFTAQNGLTFVFAKFQQASPPAPLAHTASVVAFVSTFGAYQAGTSLLKSSSQQLNLYAVEGPSGTPNTLSQPQIVDAINSHVFTALDNVQVCYSSGTTDQSGLFTIGGHGSLAVSVKIHNGKSCV